MLPRAGSQQETQHHCGQQTTSLREYRGSQRAQRQSYMTTEYQENFLPPSCNKLIISAQQGTTSQTTNASDNGTHNVMRVYSRAPQPSKDYWRWSSAPHGLTRFAGNHPVFKENNYTSVYRNDFRAWGTNRFQTWRKTDGSKINRGPADTFGYHGRKSSLQFDRHSKSASVEQKSQTFPATTCYRSDYVNHSVQPWQRSVNQTIRGPPVSQRPMLASQTRRAPADEASRLFHQFEMCSLNDTCHCRAKAQVSRPPANHNAFLSTTHAAYQPPQCQCANTILPSVDIRRRFMEPFLKTTTLRSHCATCGKKKSRDGI